MNDLMLVAKVVDVLRSGGMDVWVFGGWAEELREMRQRGAHVDIDLLLRAADFRALEACLANYPGVKEIPKKRFSHKRAFVWDGILIELVLVQPGAYDMTVMFDGRVTIRRAADTFGEDFIEGLPVASSSALSMYRRDHDQFVIAYQSFHEAQAVSG